MQNPWGVVIAVSAFLIQVIMFGISLSFGIYIVELQTKFDSSLSLISSIGSIHIGFQLVTGPLASFLMRKMSYRKVCLLGAILSSIGLSALPFTPNIPYLILFFGVITGTGNSFLYISSHTLSGLWFDKNRGLVTGLVTSGSSLGGVMFPIFIKILIETYGWRGSMFILAAFNMQTILLSGLLRESPLQRDWKKSKTKTIDSNLAESSTTIYTVLEANGNAQNNKESTSAVDLFPKQVLPKTEMPVIKEKSTLMKLLTNVPFILFTINSILWNTGASVQLLLGPDYYTKMGHSLTEAALLLTVAQGTMVCGSVAGGILGNCRSINRSVLFLSMNFITGLCTIAYTFPVLQTMTGLVVVNCLYGMSFGISLGLLVIIVSVLVGSQLIGDGMGYISLACGVGCFVGPPLGSYLIQLTESYNVAFLFAGSAELLSGLVLLIVPIKECFRRSKEYSISSSTTR